MSSTSSTQTSSFEIDDRSNEIDSRLILTNQHLSGAYPASPTYAQYRYCWLRDGSFIAYAMDREGESESAAAFHRWAAATVLTQAKDIRELIRRSERGEPILEHEFLPARFGVDGEWQQDGWPNFQLDGYGHWLWSLGEHLRRARARDVSAEVVDAARLVGDYLRVFWQEPCYDAWEEYRSQLHTSTLASIYGGLAAMGETLLPELQAVAAKVRELILEECVTNGRFVKHIGNPAIDASLLWLSTPFAVVPEDHPFMIATAEEIELTLNITGGLRRYNADTFYGGGEWLLLTAWLGWYYTRLGKLERASECLAWVESHRDHDGSLPEQVSSEAGNDRFLDYWTRRWGSPAKPLLWSHAMALVLRCELQAKED
ncbi:MAG: glycoside hydrolase family 15 protein [Trueperaceae bacterium]